MKKWKWFVPLFAGLMVCWAMPVMAQSDVDLPPDYKNAPKHDPKNDPPPPQNQPPQNQPPAQPYRPSRVRRRRAKDHHFRPIGAFRLMYIGDGSDDEPHSFGLSFGLKVLQPIELEVGVSFFPGSYSMFANTGFSWALIHRRNHRGAGVEARIAALAGYRYLHIDDFQGRDDFHGIAALGAIEFNLWFSQRFGLQLQLAGGLGFWVARSDLAMPIAYPEFRTALGILF